MGNGIMPKGGLSRLCPPNLPGKAEEAAKKQKQKKTPSELAGVITKLPKLVILPVYCCARVLLLCKSDLTK